MTSETAKRPLWGVSAACAPATASMELVDRINDRHGRCAVAFGQFPPGVRAFKGHPAFHRVPEKWELSLALSPCIELARGSYTTGLSAG